MLRTITLRVAKGDLLTHDEMDANLRGLSQDLAALEAALPGKADAASVQTSLASVTQALGDKASIAHGHAQEDVTGLPEALTALLAALALKADVGPDGKLLAAQTPTIAVVKTWPVASAEEMLALPAAPGHFAIRLDREPGFQAFILAAEPATAPLNWVPIETPEAPHTVEQIVGLVEALASKLAAADLARGTVSVTTASLAVGDTVNLELPLGKAYRLLKMSTSRPARVRVYTTSAFRAADALRTSTTRPANDNGVVLDHVTSGAQLAWMLRPPFPFGANLEDGSNTAYLAITNLDAQTGPITVTLTRSLQEF